MSGQRRALLPNQAKPGLTPQPRVARVIDGKVGQGPPRHLSRKRERGVNLVHIATPSLYRDAWSRQAPVVSSGVYIDSTATNAAAELQKLGGARVILATAPSAKAMSSLVDGLGMNGTMMVVGAAPDPIEVTPLQLISGKKRVQGWWSGIPTDTEDALRFAELTGVRPMIETFPLPRVNEAYALMLSGKAQFRVVLTM